MELSELLKKDHPAYQFFSVLALSAKETRQGTISTLLRILDEQQEQYEKLEKQREYFGFQYYSLVENEIGRSATYVRCS